MNNEPVEYKLYEITVPINAPTQDELDAMDDFERAEYQRSMTLSEEFVQRKMLEQIDRRITDLLFGRPPGLPDDPTHYTPDPNATIIDPD